MTAGGPDQRVPPTPSRRCCPNLSEHDGRVLQRHPLCVPQDPAPSRAAVPDLVVEGLLLDCQDLEVDRVSGDSKADERFFRARGVFAVEDLRAPWTASLSQSVLEIRRLGRKHL